MKFRVMKFLTNSANLVLAWLTWNFIWGDRDWGFALGAVLLSGFWLVFTGLRLRQLFRNYCDLLSRLQLLIPLFTGVVLAMLAWHSVQSPTLKVVASGEIVGWLYFYVCYRRNRLNFIKEGHGPLPKDAWINPPADAIPPLSLLLFNGNIGDKLHDAVGHGELALVGPNGQAISFSSWMEEGVVLHDLAEIAARRAKHGHYVVMRLKTPPTQEQIARAWQIAQKMLADNRAWAERVNRRHKRLINALPIPSAWKQALIKKLHASGYDWRGLFIGAVAYDHWTCIGSCLELYKRLGIRLRAYGTGLFGLGTGLLNPIMPVRFLSEPALTLLNLKDMHDYETRKALP